MASVKEIKYSRRIKSLSGIFNMCFKPSTLLLGPFLQYKLNLAQRWGRQHIVMPNTGKSLLVGLPAVTISQNIVMCKEFGYLFIFVLLWGCFSSARLLCCVLLVVLNLWKILLKLSVNSGCYGIERNRLLNLKKKKKKTNIFHFTRLVFL